MNKKNFKFKTVILSLVFAMLITLVPVSTGVRAEDTEIFNISVSTQSTTASIKWYTNKSIEGELKYGRKDQGIRSVITTDKRTDWHRYTLRDLSPNTTYKYQVIAKDSNGKV
ncbi:MAG: fibronectin type III domain-containing protein, partial [Patescibacteria group bacterium]